MPPNISAYFFFRQSLSAKETDDSSFDELGELPDEVLFGPEETQKVPEKRKPTKLRAMVPRKYPTRPGQKPGCFREAEVPDDDHYLCKCPQPFSPSWFRHAKYFMPIQTFVVDSLGFFEGH